MILEQLVGKYLRLRAELATAYAALSGDTRHIDRLDHEMASTGRAIIAAQSLDEQTSDDLPVFLSDAPEGAAGYRTPSARA